MLEYINFSKTYPGGKKAVNNLNLKIENGDIYGFIGHNGAGKTTAIRSAVGVLDFVDGDILIDGTSIKANPVECKKQLAYIPDNPDIYSHLTGIQYLNFMADIYGVNSETRQELIMKYAEEFELTNSLSDLISSYSHGMKQKVTIIGALVHSPRLLILDEPFVGLDPKAAFILKNIMHDMCSKGAAIFFSTHVLDVAEKLCNKIAIIKNGNLIASGDTASVKGNGSLEEVFLELIEK